MTCPSHPLSWAESPLTPVIPDSALPGPPCVMVPSTPEPPRPVRGHPHPGPDTPHHAGVLAVQGPPSVCSPSLSGGSKDSPLSLPSAVHPAARVTLLKTIRFLPSFLSFPPPPHHAQASQACGPAWPSSLVGPEGPPLSPLQSALAACFHTPAQPATLGRVGPGCAIGGPAVTGTLTVKLPAEGEETSDLCSSPQQRCVGGHSLPPRGCEDSEEEQGQLPPRGGGPSAER